MSNRDLLLQPTLDEGFKVNFLRRLYLPELNSLSNPGFETPGAGGADIWANWNETVGDGVLANEVVIVHEGNDAAKMTSGPTATSRATNVFVVTPGKRRRLRFWTQGDGVNDGRFYLYDVTNNDYILSTTDTGIIAVAWGIIVAEYTVPAGCISAAFGLRSPSTDGGVCYFDTCDDYLLN